MKITYIANARIPTEKAHGIQIMKMCEAFSDLGHDVLLLAPNRYNEIKTDPFEYYGVRKNFKIKKVFTFDFVKYGKLGFLIESLVFGIVATFYSVFSKSDLIYGRDEIAIAFLSLANFGKRIAWESHRGQTNFFAKICLSFATRIVVISDGLKKFYESRGIEKSKIIVAHDGVDLSSLEFDKVTIRKSYNLPAQSRIVMYTGKLGGWKGVETLLEASKEWKGGEKLVVVGGKALEVEALKGKYSDIIFLGQVKLIESQKLQRVADVLVIPNTAKNEISRSFTSPLKVFEYMMSGRPIVASDLPSIREVLNDETAYFAVPDDTKSFANAIDNALSEEKNAEEKAKRAYEEVKKYSWTRRAKIILEKI